MEMTGFGAVAQAPGGGVVDQGVAAHEHGDLVVLSILHGGADAAGQLADEGVALVEEVSLARGVGGGGDGLLQGRDLGEGVVDGIQAVGQLAVDPIGGAVQECVGVLDRAGQVARCPDHVQAQGRVGWVDAGSLEAVEEGAEAGGHSGLVGLGEHGLDDGEGVVQG
jgi:hypothetical protein